MNDNRNLESLYTEARQALKAKDYDRASGLLRQILLIDENYKDASRLLAQTVKLRRRHWYNHPLLWSTLGLIVLVALGLTVAPRLQGFYAPPPSASVTDSPTATLQPTLANTATTMPTAAPTAIPLTWKRIAIGQEFPRDVIISALIDENDPEVMYVGTANAGVFKSIDGGNSWQPDHDPEIEQELASRVFTVPNWGENPPGITITTENGEEYHYRILATGLEFSNDGKTWKTHRFQCTYLLKQSPNQAYTYCKGDLYSLPGLNQVGTKVPMDKAFALAVADQSEDVIVIGGREELFITKDRGATWENQTDGLGSRTVDLKISPQGLLFAQDGSTSPNTSCNLFRSPDKGHTWTRIIQAIVKLGRAPEGCGLSFSADGSTLFWNGYAQMTHSTDNGDSWKVWGGYRHLEGDTSGYFSLTPLTPHPKEDAIFYVLPHTVFATLDNQKTWFAPLKQFGEGPAPFARMYFDHQDGSEIYLVYSNEGYEGGVFHSTDFGRNWERCHGTPGPTPSDTRLVIDPRDSNHVVLATHGNGVAISKDGCRSWQPSNEGLTHRIVNTLAIDNNHPDTILAGTDGGAFISTNGGETWGQVNDGLLGATVVYSIVVDKDSNVYAATPYGIFKLESK